MQPVHVRPALNAGDLIDDIYAVERFIAGGSMGQVYVARDIRLDRLVALKLLTAEVAASGDYAARFVREARALSKVNHPNVAMIFGFGEHEGHVYIAMEYVEGDSLEDVLFRDETLELADAVALVRHVATALAEAHGRGIVHRDIKPGNILLRRSAEGAVFAKVVDFGLARSYERKSSDITNPHSVVGTPWYMSPEQCNGEPLDGRSDLYSLAVVLFHMLTGVVPFDDDTPAVVLAAHVNQPAPNLPRRPGRRAWPAALQREISKALAKLPEDRHPDVMAFVAAIEQAAGLTKAALAGRVECATCGADTAAGARYCGECGGPLPRDACPSCGTDREAHRYHCASCGTSLLPARRRPSSEAGEGLTEVTAAALVARFVRRDRGAELDFAERFAVIAEREGGRPIAVTGREALALFGIGGLHEQAPTRAVDAGLAIVNAFGEDSVQVGLELGAVHTRGAGVAWGTALAWGPAIEAARDAARALQGEEPRGGVSAGPTIYDEVSAAYATNGLPDEVHRRVRRRKRLDLTPATFGGRVANIPLIARDLELEQLLLAARTVRRSGQLRFVPVIGPAGVGKSRLLLEFGRIVEDAQETWWWDAAAATPSELAPAFGPFVEMLRARLRVQETTGRDDMTRRLLNLPGLSGGDAGFDQFASRVSAFGRLIGLSTPDGSSARPATAAERRAAFDLYAAYVRGASAQLPMVLLIEDLQWARAPSLELLAHVVRACGDSPVLVVASMRADAADQVLAAVAPGGARTAPVHVAPLPDGDGRTLLSALADGLPLPPEAVGAIADFAAGLPLHIEEGFDALVDRGALKRTEDGWTLAGDEPATAALKGSFGDVVLRRVANLEPAVRRVLTATAVAGESAPISVIDAMLDRGLDVAALWELGQRGFVAEARRRRFGGEPEYVFRQPMLRDLVLVSTPRGELRAMHERAAAWLMAWDGARAPGLEARIAQHLLAAERPVEAAAHLLNVAREATSAFANQEAFEAYGAALDAARRAWVERRDPEGAAPPLALEAGLARAELGLRLGEHSDALAAAEAAAEAVTEIADPPPLASLRAVFYRAEALAPLGHTDAALHAYRLAATLALSTAPEGLPDSSTRERRAAILIRALARVAGLYVTRGQLDDGETWVREAIDAGATHRGGPEVKRALATAYRALGHLRAAQARPSDAADAYEAAQQQFTAAGDHEGAARAGLARGVALLNAGWPAKAQTTLEDIAPTLERLGLNEQAALAWLNAGKAIMGGRRAAEAFVALDEALRVSRAAKIPAMLMEALQISAKARMKTGEIALARRLAAEAMRVATEFEDHDTREEMRRLLQTVAAEEAMSSTAPMRSDKVLTRHRDLADRLGLGQEEGDDA